MQVTCVVDESQEMARYPTKKPWASCCKPSVSFINVFYGPIPAAFRPSHQPTRLTALVPTLHSKACVGEKDVPLCVRSQDVDEDCLTLFMMSNENQFHYLGTYIDIFYVDPADTVSWPLTRNRHQ